MEMKGCNHIIGYGIYEQIVSGMRGNYIEPIRMSESKLRYEPMLYVDYCPDCGKKVR